MKTMLYLVAAFGLAANAGADPNRYEWRSFGGVNIDLLPLFSWWTYVSRATNQPMDITEMDKDKFVVVSNEWARLPPRPLPEWFRIVGDESGITIVGSMWRMNAEIESAPMLLKHETIYIQDPPTREIHDFKVARSEYLALQGAQNNDVLSEQLMQSNIQAEAVALLQTNVQPNIPPGAPPVNRPTPRTLQRDSVMTISNLNSAHARTVARAGQLAPLEKYLATFPDKNVYWLDHFAKRTGKKIDGIEVYDLGAAAELTY